MCELDFLNPISVSKSREWFALICIFDCLICRKFSKPEGFENDHGKSQVSYIAS